MKKYVSIVLVVHVAILLMVWGGLSALGVATALMLPIMGLVAWAAYSTGRNNATNLRMARRAAPETQTFHTIPGVFRG